MKEWILGPLWSILHTHSLTIPSSSLVQRNTEAFRRLRRLQNNRQPGKHKYVSKLWLLVWWLHYTIKLDLEGAFCLISQFKRLTNKPVLANEMNALFIQILSTSIHTQIVGKSRKENLGKWSLELFLEGEITWRYFWERFSVLSHLFSSMDGWTIFSQSHGNPKQIKKFQC